MAWQMILIRMALFNQASFNYYIRKFLRDFFCINFILLIFTIGSVSGYRGGFGGLNSGRGVPGFGRGGSSYSNDPGSGAFQGRDDLGRGGSSRGRDMGRGGPLPPSIHQSGRDGGRGGAVQGRGASSTGRGSLNVRGHGMRGSFQGDRDFGTGFSGRPQPGYGSYGSDTYSATDEPGSRYGGGSYGPGVGKPVPEYPNSYQRNNSYPGYTGGGPGGYSAKSQTPYQDPNATYPIPQNVYPGGENYSIGKGLSNPNRPVFGGSQDPGSESLYASGSSKFSDGHLPGPPQQRQSRFDSKPSGNFSTGFGNVDKQKHNLQVNSQTSGPRSGRSRFDSVPTSVPSNQGGQHNVHPPVQSQLVASTEVNR